MKRIVEKNCMYVDPITGKTEIGDVTTTTFTSEEWNNLRREREEKIKREMKMFSDIDEDDIYMDYPEYPELCRTLGVKKAREIILEKMEEEEFGISYAQIEQARREGNI